MPPEADFSLVITEDYGIPPFPGQPGLCSGRAELREMDAGLFSMTAGSSAAAGVRIITVR
ncbi:MAG: hypothetical protein V8T45_07910 [Oscillospiraceae bacterium]